MGSVFQVFLWGDDYIISKLQENLDKTKEVIADICKLSNIHEKLVLLQCIPGRIQHLLAAVPMKLSRDFAKQHDEALLNAVVATIELEHLTDRDRLLSARSCRDGEESGISFSCWLHAVN